MDLSHPMSRGNQGFGRELFFSLHKDIVAVTQACQLVRRVDEAAGYCKHSCSKSQFLFIMSTTLGISSSLPRPCHTTFCVQCNPQLPFLQTQAYWKFRNLIQKHTHHQSQTLSKFCIRERPSRSNLPNQTAFCYYPYHINERMKKQAKCVTWLRTSSPEKDAHFH